MTSSRLQHLLETNAYKRKLTDREWGEAVQLMDDTDGDKCWLCGEPSVGGTQLCHGHAFYALATRK